MWVQNAYCFHDIVKLKNPKSNHCKSETIYTPDPQSKWYIMFFKREGKRDILIIQRYQQKCRLFIPADFSCLSLVNNSRMAMSNNVL